MNISSVTIFLVTITIVITLILVYLAYKSNDVSRINLYSLPSDIEIDNVEAYIFKSSRLKRIEFDRFSDTLYLSPKFTSTYYNSAYNNVCDLKENAITSMYLTTIGNINLSGKILNSMLYIMIENDWNPFSESNQGRLANYKGIPNLYSIDILKNTVSLPQKISDVSSIYISMALMKFLLTYDKTLSSNLNYLRIRKAYVTAAYDLWKYIVDNQMCSEGQQIFHSHKTILGGLAQEFSTNFHIAMYACCNYLDIIVEKYGVVIDSKLSISSVRDVCINFINNSNKENGNIIAEFGDCNLSYNEADLFVLNKTSEDYLSLLMLDYPLDQNALVDNLLTYLYVPDTDSLPTGCGPGVYNLECEDKNTDVSKCYNITCDPKYVPKDRVMYGMKWSSKGTGLTFAMSALTILVFAMIENLSDKAVNLRNSLFKVYKEYRGLFIIGGFQEELFFSQNPLNTGTGDSVFRYPSLLAVVLSGFLFLYLKTKDKEVNYLKPSSKNFNISNSILDFDDSPLFSLL